MSLEPSSKRSASRASARRYSASALAMTAETLVPSFFARSVTHLTSSTPNETLGLSARTRGAVAVPLVFAAFPTCGFAMVLLWWAPAQKVDGLES